MKKNCFLGLLLTTALPLLSFSQTTRTVCSSGCDFTTIKAAAAAASSGDVILLNVNGAHTEKDIVLPEKSLTIRGLGKTTTILQAASTKASASGGRIFSYGVPVTGGNSFVFEDMTIRNAYAPLVDGQSNGSVFYASGSLKGLAVSATRVRFSANETTAGNIYNSGGACFYISGTSSSNVNLQINDCEFDNNYVANSSGTSLTCGGCFYLAGSPNAVTIKNSTFTNNSSYIQGGVLYAAAAWAVTISNCSFENNQARNGDGGCLMIRSSGAVNIDNCLFRNNAAVYVSAVNGNNGYGGALFTKDARITNCTFYGNSALRGGAIYRSNSGTNSALQLVNNTFYANAASQLGRTIQYGSTTTSTSSFPLVMVNNIIANGTGAAPAEINFSLPYAQLTVNEKNYCNSVSSDNGSPGTAPAFAFTSSNTTLGLAASTANNGGPTQTLALTSASSLINAGTHTSNGSYDIPIKDHRNYSRADGAIDIGAFEYNGILDNAVAPGISHTLLGNTMQTTNRVVSATITDDNGVYWFAQSTDRRPRIYFRKNNGSWVSNAGTLTGGNGLSGNWDFTISSSAMGGLSNGDKVDYFILSQDVSTNASLVSLPAGVVAADVNTVTSVPSPRSYLIGSTLPVVLAGFNAVKSGPDVLVTWEVSLEETLLHYEVEKSTDGVAWQAAGRVASAKSRFYSFADKKPGNQTVYYRLRATNLDGSFSVSPVRQVKMAGEKGLSLYPNPLTSGPLNIRLENAATLRLFDSRGALIWQKQLPAGSHAVDMGHLPRGAYRLISGSESYPLLLQ